MKNSTYNTGRKVTINLDTLGNAALWQIFQILTDGTGNTFYGNEEEASPAADPDAACEVFLHAAETANDRAAGADAAQRAWLQEMVAEYLEIFETNPADDLRKRLGKEAETITRTALSGHEYTAANIDLAEAVAERNACPVSLTADDNARELRATGTAAAIEDFFAYCKEAARAAEEEPAADADDAATIEAEVAAWRSNPANEDLDAALKANARDTNGDPNNLYRAGVFAGLAEAAAWMIYGRGICPDDINAITAAVYKAYWVAW